MEAQPVAAFGYEVLGGWVGAAGGGVGGFMIGLLLCLLTLSDHSGFQALGCFVGGGTLGYLLGTPLGATIGVSVVGHFNHIQGNVWMGLLGGFLGEGAGILTLSGLVGIGVDSDFGGVGYVLGVPLISALGTATGFNIGAEVVPQPEAAE